MNEATQQRLSEISALDSSIESAGKPLIDYLRKMLSDETESLIREDSENIRGRVQLLKKLIDLPQSLRDEARLLMQELP